MIFSISRFNKLDVFSVKLSLVVLLLLGLIDNTYAIFRLQIHGVTQMDGAANRAIGCKPVDANGEVECVAFNDYECYRRKYKSTGEVISNWVKDTTCGYNNVDNAYAEFSQLKQEGGTVAGDSPKTPAVFSEGLSYYNPYHTIFINGVDAKLGLTHLDHASLGCRKDEDPNYVECFVIYGDKCVQAKYAINGALVSKTTLPNCGYDTIPTPKELYESLDLVVAGRDPDEPGQFTTRAIYPWSNRGVELYVNGYKQLVVPITIGCGNDSEDSNIINCYAFNEHNCYLKQFRPNGALLADKKWLGSENCSYYHSIEKTTEIYDSLNLVVEGMSPNHNVPLVADYTTLWSHKTYGVIARPHPHYPGVHGRYLGASNSAAGCYKDADNDNYFHCTVIEPNSISRAIIAKNATISPEGWVKEENTGYDVDPEASLEEYNKLTFTRIGPPPEVAAAEFTMSQNTTNSLYYLSVKGVIDYKNSGTKAGGCKPLQDDHRECFLFSYNHCLKAKYHKFGGLVEGWTLDYECGYNNNDATTNIYNSLDSEVRLGDPPNPEPASFKGGFYTGRNRLSVNGEFRTDGEAHKSIGCLPEADGKVQCIAFNVNECWRRSFDVYGYPLTGWVIDYNCGYYDFTAAIELYNSLDPASIYGEAPKAAEITASELNGEYKILINGAPLDGAGTRSIGCSPIENDNRTCYAFNQADCWSRVVNVTGALMSKWIQNKTCGYTNHLTAAAIYNTLDTGILAGDPPGQSAVFKGKLDTAQQQYYLTIGGEDNLDQYFNRAVGCYAEENNEVKCVGFNQLDCYERKFTRFGAAIDGWTKGEDCGYAYYTVALDIFNSLQSNTIAGDTPTPELVPFKGKLVNDRYYLTIYNEVMTDAYVTQAMGCKPPGIDIDGGDDTILECVAFGTESCFRKQFKLTGQAVTFWEEDSSCGYQNPQAALDEYNKLNDYTVAGDAPVVE